MKRHIFFIPCALGAACLLLGAAASAQDVDVSWSHKNDGKTVMDKETASQEERPQLWQFTGSYESRYIFRGTDLTPNSDGILSFDARATIPYGFARGDTITAGAWVGYQIGTATVPFATAVGEAGSGELLPFDLFRGKDTAIQTGFKEVDLYLTYAHSFGWVDLTVGNIAFVIERDQIDHFEYYNVNTRMPFVPPHFFDFKSIGNESFDRLFVSLSTRKLKWVVPTITYHQTILNMGDDGAQLEPIFSSDFSRVVRFERKTGEQILGFSRNDSLGGYLEAKVAATVPLGERFTLAPVALVSYSFDDRSEAQMTRPTAVPLTGFNHFQTGAELTWAFAKNVSLIAFGDYAYHFASPTAGTDRNMWWGGVRFRVNF